MRRANRTVTGRRGLLIAAACCAFGALMSSLAAGGVPAPPPPQPCSIDTDCPDCEVCAGGGCAPMFLGTYCFCHDECARIGKVSCVVSATKPRCGGSCSNAPITAPLTCSAGADSVAIEAWDVSVKDSPNGATVLPTPAIVIEEVAP